MSARVAPRRPSELALLVETESRLDGALEAARANARASIAAARRRAEVADVAVADDIARERARIACDAQARVIARREAIAAAARAEIVRYDATRGEALTGIVRALVDRLVAIALEDAP